MQGRFIISDKNETLSLASEFIKNLRGSEFIAISGNLGAGKTFFVKAIGELSGISEVSSPTFALLNYYRGNKFNIYHYDFYRLKKSEELFDIGFYENLEDENAIKIAEWADMFPEVLPLPRLSVGITLLENGKREYVINQID